MISLQTILETLDREEVLRYLGYRGNKLPQELDSLIDSCIRNTLSLITPKYLCRRFSLEQTEEGLLLKGTDVIFRGNDIAAHLKNCKEVYLLCLTVGLEIEKKIRLSMMTAPDEGVIYDSCASTAIEGLADKVEQEISQAVSKEGLHTTWRFSPGYGDFPLETQRELLTLMEAHKRIGLSLNSSLLLTPGKSVTAVIGVTDCKKDPRSNKCDYCGNRNSCEFRKRGTKC